MTKQKIMGFVTSLVCLVLLVLGAVSAWQNTNQHKTFESETKETLSSVTLRKYALDAQDKETETLLANTLFRLFKKNSDDSTRPIQIGVSYQTDENGEIFLDDLTPGSYYFEEVTPTGGYDFLADDTGKAITQFPFEIKGIPDEHLYLSVYNRLLTGDLTIQKQVTVPEGWGLTDADKAQVFHFTVTFTENGQPVTESFTYTIDGTDFTIKSGEQLSLKHGQEAVFKNLPQSIQYAVTEDAVAGYVSHGTNTVGHLSGTPQVVKFSNLKEICGFKVTKRVTDATDSQDGRAYEFTVVFSDGKQYQPIINGRQVQLTATGQFYLKADETASFTDVPNGVSYTVIEAASPDYLTDVTMIHGTTMTNQVPNYVVTNSFDVETRDLLGDLVIQKVVSGKGVATDAFTFKVTFDSGETHPYTLTANGQTKTGQIKSGDTIKLVAGAVLTISGLPLGTTYQVEEVDFGSYQPVTKVISGTIWDVTQAAVAMFENIAPPTLTVVKKVVGAPTGSDQAFEFTLHVSGQPDQTFTLKANESKTFTLPYGASYQVIETDAKSDGYRLTHFDNNSREKILGDVTATAINTYIGVAEVEISGEKTWIIPASVVMPDYIIVQLLDASGVVIAEQTVKPDVSGKWLYTFKAPKFDANGVEIKYQIREVGLPHFDSQVTGYDIKNTYVTPVSLVPQVEKRLTGDTPEQAGEFTFILTTRQPQAIEKKSMTISGEGIGVFDTLHFDAAGEYVYEIYEQTGNLSGYSYDRATYQLIVKVVQDEQTLKIVSASYRRDDGQVSDWAIFTNDYQAVIPPPPVIPPVVVPPSVVTPPSSVGVPPSSTPLPDSGEDKSLLKTGEQLAILPVMIGLALLIVVSRKWLKARYQLRLQSQTESRYKHEQPYKHKSSQKD